MATERSTHLGFGLQRKRLKNYIALISVLGAILASAFWIANGTESDYPVIILQTFLASLFLGLYFFSRPNWLWALLGSQVVFVTLQISLHSDLRGGGLSYSRLFFSILAPIAALCVENRIRGSVGQID